MVKTLGDFIRECRDKQDISLRELARKVQCSPAYLSDVELGRRNPTDKMISRIAKALGIKKAEVLRYDTRPPIEDIRKLTTSNPNYAFAFRNIIDKKLDPDELLDLVNQYKPKKKK